jgi:hypothetical protein
VGQWVPGSVELEGPDGFRSLVGIDPYESARIGLAGEDVIIGVSDSEAFLWFDTNEAWRALGGPAHAFARPRGFAAFDGGVMVVGRDSQDGGHVLFSRGGIACSTHVRSPVNAVSVRAEDTSVFMVTSGVMGIPSMVEVRIR